MSEKLTIEEHLMILESIFKDNYDKFPAVRNVIEGIREILKEKGEKTMNCCNRPMQEVLTQHANPLRDTCYVTHYRCQECKGTRIKLHRPY